ncbi:hypothetical protein [Microbacterium sp. gxy059]|uniref:hypothetical protein n=1 Tax=Microbacterium sp. gxy059 TaxID=2957199 RepID=UPI003D96133E
MVAMQIRDVPDEDRDALAAQARERGVSLQTLLRELVSREAKAQRQRQWLAEVTSRAVPRPEGVPSLAETIRDDRERDATL